MLSPPKAPFSGALRTQPPAGRRGRRPPTNIPGTAVVRRLPAGWGHPALRAAYKTLRRRDFRRVPLYIQKRQPPSQGLALISNIQPVFTPASCHRSAGGHARRGCFPAGPRAAGRRCPRWCRALWRSHRTSICSLRSMVSSPCIASSIYSRMSFSDIPVFFRHSIMRSHS